MIKTKDERIAARAQELACEFIVRQGMKILDRNWKCGYGDMDIIALDGSTLVFCRVNFKQGDIRPISCSPKSVKEETLKLMNVYRTKSAVDHDRLRLDYVSIFTAKSGQKAHLHYIKEVAEPVNP